ncbi:uncharacterized protein LOC110467102 [Mizuhopecten yessoensis]|uniref:uncharacterized protein LOC110467102 n=1 Tax=Mizuhopecten yessoensis TaxID=6573 RepID=UPI000B457239|nr:uncharacterized protein LOC110467102 [Mizuhopecten yessoensis]
MADEVHCYQRNDATMHYTSGLSTEKIKRTRVGLTARHKREICLYKQFNPKATQENLVQFCKDKWNLPAGRTTLGEILRQKDKWLSITPDQEEMRRSRGGRHNKLEMELFKWISAQRKIDTSITLSDQMIIEHAKILGEELHIDQSFSYSNGWLFKFKKRHGIKSRGTTGRFQILEDCYSYNDRNPGVAFNRKFPDYSGSDSETMLHGTQNMFTNVYDSNVNESGIMDQSQFYPPYMNIYGQKESVSDSSQSQAISPSAVPTEMIIKEEYVSDNENSNDYYDVNEADESGNSVQTSVTHSPLLQLECENEAHGTSRRQYVPKEKDNSECSSHQRRPHRTILPISTKRIITASEAKHGALLCIRYLEQHPDLGEHLDTVWEVHDDIEAHHKGVMTNQRTITDYFRQNRTRSDIRL